LDIQSKQMPLSEKNLDNTKNSLSYMYKTRGQRLQDSSLYAESIIDFQQALVYKQEGAIYDLISFSYYKLEEYAKAIENDELAHRFGATEKWIYLNNTSLAHAHLGEFEEAKIRLEQLENLLPNNSLTFRNWGLYYLLTGKLTTSLDNLEKAIELGYDNWEWLRTEEALEPLRNHPRFQVLLEQAPSSNE